MQYTDYTIYKTATGHIVSNGNTNCDLSEIILNNDESIIEGIYEINKYKIIDGLAIEQDINFWIKARNKRNALLSESDWTQLSDISEQTKTKWIEYRQELRDLPQTYKQVDNIDDVIFPSIPE
nr:putative phage tail fiber protein [uncultured Mediterranean phage uvMED]BAR29160.1 putative phage tail fiber protein [uncultured Mediterranean phage uvMED]BAR29197.1 putative phage tail fiber protein [uncultured Mediterranean phage uvMED]|tara:strand:- start:136 stop:504 length:369 start_codon:yes stop_codon:yes gene_type:complete